MLNIRKWGTVIGLMFLFSFARSQQIPDISELDHEVIETGTYIPFPNGKIFRMKFLGSEIWSSPRDQILAKDVSRVDIIYTKYPQHTETWKIGHDNLLRKRIAAIQSYVPGLCENKDVKWRFVLQTDGKTLEEAKQMFHGAYVYYKKVEKDTFIDEPVKKVRDTLYFPDSIAVKGPRFDSMELLANWRKVLDIWEGRKSFYDSSAISIFNAHRDWEDMGLVFDWTASMYGYGAQALSWIRDSLGFDKIGYVALFNDGDGLYDEEKLPGATGGIYGCDPSDENELLKAMESVTKGGEGGDHRENNIEALIFAIDHCPDCKNFVMIADNSAPVRDLELLDEISQPVRIILKGVYNDNIHPDYLTIAYMTKGGIFYRDGSLNDLSGKIMHNILTIGENQYELRNDRFFKK